MAFSRSRKQAHVTRTLSVEGRTVHDTPGRNARPGHMGSYRTEAEIWLLSYDPGIFWLRPVQALSTLKHIKKERDVFIFVFKKDQSGCCVQAGNRGSLGASAMVLLRIPVLA